jgi:hypothetical protein
MQRSTLRRLWLCLPPLLCCADVWLTLHGQSADYWRGVFSTVHELNPLARWCLLLHPLAFVAAAVLWGITFCAALLFAKRRWAGPLALLITFGHALGTASWLTNFGVPGYIAAAGVFLGAGCLLRACRRLARTDWPAPAPSVR